MNLQKKHIVITGGTSGIGLEIVKILAPDNQVIVISRKEKLTEELTKGKYPVRLYHADLANKSELESVVDNIHREYPVIDLLINNAAVQFTPEFLSDDFNYDGIQTEVDVNFTSICHLSYLFMAPLLAAENGVILNINSGLVIAPKTGSAIYCATKSALDSFSKSLSYQLQNTTVSVQQVFLPLVETGMTTGRGSGKLIPSFVAEAIVDGVTRGKKINNIGKVKLLRLINYLLPPLATRIMKAG